ncbi:hypothetical protein ABH962_000347 [Bacillus sp. RC54]
MAIYRPVQVSYWQDAFVLDLTPEELCKSARDNKEPISIRLYLSLEQSFIPDNVVEYL